MLILSYPIFLPIVLSTSSLLSFCICYFSTSNQLLLLSELLLWFFLFSFRSVVFCSSNFFLLIVFASLSFSPSSLVCQRNEIYEFSLQSTTIQQLNRIHLLILLMLLLLLFIFRQLIAVCFDNIILLMLMLLLF